MANIIFAERENAGLHAPTQKMRQRLQSAPGMKIMSLVDFFFFFCSWNADNVCIGATLTFFVPAFRETSQISYKTIQHPLAIWT